MHKLASNLFGSPDRCFRIGGRRFHLTGSGKRTLRLLDEIVDAGSNSRDPAWLLQQRMRIRTILSLKQRAVLSFVIERTADPSLRIIAIWLRGRCGGTLGTNCVAFFANHRDEQIRKEVARSLKRMGAWVQLTKMENDPSARVRRLAIVKPMRPYEERLNTLSKRLERLHTASKQPMPLYVSAEVDFGQQKQPKSLEYIRMIIERIHYAVTGSFGRS